MPRPLRALCLLILPFLLPTPLRASDEATAAWSSATPGWKYEFPRDHGPHRKFKTEWWYATGTLTDEQGREYGFQLTFFRQGIRPGEKQPGASRFRVMEIPFAHFALSDVSGKAFSHFQRSSRGAFGEAGFGVPPGKMAWMEDWAITEDQEGRLHLKARDGKENGQRAVDLVLTQQRPPLLHGNGGISPKSAKPGHASHYYSLTRLGASGTVTVGGKVHPVTGLVWFDHEWATNSLDPGEAGWDWSGLHLSTGEDLMLFRIRDGAGNPVFLSGTLRDAKGALSDIKDLTMTPTGTWKSPHTGGLYPAGFEISIPSHALNLTLSPKLADQELVLSPFAYWEGTVKGAGKKGGAPVTAEGYLELTGYGGKVIGVNGP
jgi:predicted secreted hydrolase